MKAYVVLMGLAVALAGCVSAAGNYTPPAETDAVSNSIVIDKPLDEVWSAAIPRIGKTFFVINNLDKASGLINVSYSGDPERYLDCGRATIDVTGPQGKQHYEFAGAAQHTTYSVAAPIPGNPYGIKHIIPVERTMNLDGRVNVVFEKLEGGRTRVTATTRYVVKRVLMSPQGRRTDTIELTTGEQSEFPALGTWAPTTCRPTGALEAELLKLVS